MIGELKLIGPPLFAVGILFSSVLDALPDAVRIILDLAALGILLAGFLVLGKLKAQTAAAEGSAGAWREERDAAFSKVDRLQQENIACREDMVGLRVQIAELQARPTLDSVSSDIAQLKLLVQEALVHPFDSTGEVNT